MLDGRLTHGEIYEASISIINQHNSYLGKYWKWNWEFFDKISMILQYYSIFDVCSSQPCKATVKIQPSKLLVFLHKQSNKDQFQRQAIFLSQSSKSLRRFPTVLFIARAFCTVKSTTPIDTDVGFYTAVVDTGGPETARAAPLCTRGGRRARRCHRRRCDIREYFAVCFAVCARMSQAFEPLN